MDIRMPGMDGVEATARLTAAGSSRRRACSCSRRSISTSMSSAPFVPAPSSSRTPRARSLLEAIRVVHDGEALLSPAITPPADRGLRRPHRPARAPAAVLEQLTPTSGRYSVLVARGLSNTEIAERLVVTEATVKSHVGSILMSSTSAIAYKPSSSRTSTASLLPATRVSRRSCSRLVAP